MLNIKKNDLHMLNLKIIQNDHNNLVTNCFQIFLKLDFEGQMWGSCGCKVLLSPAFLLIARWNSVRLTTWDWLIAIRYFNKYLTFTKYVCVCACVFVRVCVGGGLIKCELNPNIARLSHLYCYVAMLMAVVSCVRKIAFHTSCTEHSP